MSQPVVMWRNPSITVYLALPALFIIPSQQSSQTGIPRCRGLSIIVIELWPPRIAPDNQGLSRPEPFQIAGDRHSALSSFRALCCPVSKSSGYVTLIVRRSGNVQRKERAFLPLLFTGVPFHPPHSRSHWISFFHQSHSSHAILQLLCDTASSHISSHLQFLRACRSVSRDYSVLAQLSSPTPSLIGAFIFLYILSSASSFVSPVIDLRHFLIQHVFSPTQG